MVIMALILMIFFLSSGEHVAQFKFTVLLMPNGPHKITGLPFEEELYSSEHSVKDADIQVLLPSTKHLLFTTLHSLKIWGLCLMKWLWLAIFLEHENPGVLIHKMHNLLGHFIKDKTLISEEWQSLFLCQCLNRTILSRNCSIRTSTMWKKLCSCRDADLPLKK